MDLSWSEISEIKIKDKDLIFLNGKEEKHLKNKNQFVAFNEKNENLVQF